MPAQCPDAACVTKTRVNNAHIKLRLPLLSWRTHIKEGGEAVGVLAKGIAARAQQHVRDGLVPRRHRNVQRRLVVRVDRVGVCAFAEQFRDLTSDTRQGKNSNTI